MPQPNEIGRNLYHCVWQQDKSRIFQPPEITAHLLWKESVLVDFRARPISEVQECPKAGLTTPFRHPHEARQKVTLTAGQPSWGYSLCGASGDKSAGKKAGSQAKMEYRGRGGLDGDKQGHQGPSPGQGKQGRAGQGRAGHGDVLCLDGAHNKMDLALRDHW